jgi:thiosulfate dehydrogenase
LLKRSVLFVLPCIAAALPSLPATVQADDVEGYGKLSSAQHLVVITRGGVLYDNWYSALGKKDPKDTHPAYPKAGKKKGGATWRCKECHGWDYKGANGAYGKGSSHYTGIGGLRNLTHASIDSIVATLKDKTHGFGELIPAKDLEALAHFVAHGQLDMDDYIDRASSKAKGDAANGERIYQTTCARCHGSDGTLINFQSPPKIEYVGTVASSMLAFDIQDHIDVLAYCQTLPAK